jgi:hypothetical protein
VIGDRESRNDRPDLGEYGPLSAMVRLDRPGGYLAFIERYERLVLTRYMMSPAPDSGLIMSETMYPTEARAVREIAYRITAMGGRGYRVVDE